VNSLHEGTNNKLRHSSNRIGPSTLIHNSSIILNQNAVLDHNFKAIRDSKVFRSTKLYADLACADYLVPTAYWMLSNAWNRRSIYDSIRTPKNMWLVVYNPQKGDQFNNSWWEAEMKFKKENGVSKTKRKVKKKKKEGVQ